MSDASTVHEPGLSRRHLIGLGAAVGAAGLASVAAGSPAGAAAARPTASGPAAAPFPQALAPAVAGLTYLPIDASAFHTADVNGAQTRLLFDLTGVQPQTPANFIYAPLQIPAGSIVRQVNVSYQTQPITFIDKRPFGSTTIEEVFTTGSPPLGPQAQAASFDANVAIDHGASYRLRVFCSAGDSIYGITVGYQPPTQGFVPLSPIPRPLDTRLAGGKLAPDEERLVNLGLPAGARGAVLNLTLTETEGTFGFVAAFAGDVAYPGNSSMNWFGPGQTTANAVITAVDALGQIKIRGGVAATHVVIDVVGIMQ